MRRGSYDWQWCIARPSAITRHMTSAYMHCLVITYTEAYVQDVVKHWTPMMPHSASRTRLYIHCACLRQTATNSISDSEASMCFFRADDHPKSTFYGLQKRPEREGVFLNSWAPRRFHAMSSVMESAVASDLFIVIRMIFWTVRVCKDGLAWHEKTRTARQCSCW